MEKTNTNAQLNKAWASGHDWIQSTWTYCWTRRCSTLLKKYVQTLVCKHVLLSCIGVTLRILLLLSEFYSFLIKCEICLYTSALKVWLNAHTHSTGIKSTLRCSWSNIDSGVWQVLLSGHILHTLKRLPTTCVCFTFIMLMSTSEHLMGVTFATSQNTFTSWKRSCYLKWHSF